MLWWRLWLTCHSCNSTQLCVQLLLHAQSWLQHFDSQASCKGALPLKHKQLQMLRDVSILFQSEIGNLLADVGSLAIVSVASTAPKAFAVMTGGPALAGLGDDLQQVPTCIGVCKLRMTACASSLWPLD